MAIPIAELVLAAAVGAALGAWFFGGLLWTVRRVATAQHPVLLLLASFVVRIAVVAGGMVWLARRHWLLPIIALAVLLVVRFGMLMRWPDPGRAGPVSKA